jgi:hypothetical protein
VEGLRLEDILFESEKLGACFEVSILVHDLREECFRCTL